MTVTIRKQRLLAFILAALIYFAVIACVGFYLLFHGEETVQRRYHMTPHIDVSLFDAADQPVDPVPDSWKDDMVLEEPDKSGDAQLADGAANDTANEIDDDEQVETSLHEDDARAENAKQAVDKIIAAEPVIQETITQEIVTQEPETPVVSVNPDAVPVPDRHIPVWKRHARPFTAQEKRPIIALVVSDLGLARHASDAAVQDLPGEVTLAFSSLVPDLDNWSAKARAAGHEVLLTIPMEPNNYPQNDPGPNALLLTQEDAQNLVRLQRALERAQGIVGVTPYMGDKFVTNEAKMSPVMQLLRDKELVFFDHSLSGSSVVAPLARLGKMPFARADLKIDAAANMLSIDEQLANLEKIALERGYAVGVALPYPVTFERLKLWIAGLNKKGITLAPLSAVVTIDPEQIQIAPASPAP